MAGDNCNMGNKGDCGSMKTNAEIQPHMDVISSCGCKMGTVDHLEGGSVKLTRKDSPDGQHHFVPLSWVDHVDEHLHLNKNADEVRRAMQSEGAEASSV